MEKNLHTKIFDKLLDNTENLDSVEKTTIISIFAMVVIYGIIQVIFLIYFLNRQIPEMVFTNAVSVIICLLNLYVLSDLKRLRLGLLMWVTNSCYFIIAMTYILGYNKNSIIFLPVLLLLIHVVFPKKRKYIFVNTHIVLITFFLNLYVKYNIEAKYYDMFNSIEVINSFCALVLASLIIYLKSTTDELINKHNLKQLDGLFEEVDALTTEASVDFLTGLWNRRYVEKQLEEIDLTGAYIILTDIDYFKSVNDKYGHLCGDYILKEVSQVLKNAFRNDDLVCRWGGEEFLIYLKNVKNLNVKDKLERIRKTVEETTYEYNEHAFKVTLTFGFVHIVEDLSMDENIEKADAALYYGKNKGRNCIYSYDDMEK